ncbi:intradiol ring-cleavage dioxygenase [Sphingomonas crocodyli]|uniref:Intradiol ring-cleavage dioxygenase n=1 Tax=Sphingomonas crocodyli TaxID=1979270 RepID=A0A437MBA3_9SPHN|nr:intradiol ring-cleavage dioxygenase [Sphingomonas crocodyli]RVT94905.1 intradiol ring-cleavage dioxygenase [Sphingomonas crocodyli]
MHDHDRGLAFDLDTISRQIVERRRLLGWFAGAGATALLTGCGGGSSSSTETASSTTTSSTTTSTSTTTGTTTTTTSTSTGQCVADAAETAGPYPADGTNSASGSTSNVLTSSGIVRSDIRSSFISSTTVASGVLLTITLTVVNVNASCAPLSGYAVYLWHCNVDGNYSLYTVPGESYLRGVQVTNSAGQVTFTTIFPACYDGRYPHMHFEVFTSLSAATSGRAATLTSQFAMPRDVCSTVYAGSSLYSSSVSRLAAVTTTNDNVFGDNSSAQIAAMTPSLTGSISAGYTGTVTIGVSV